MQDQGKRLLLAVALALGVMLLWNAIFSPKNPGQKPKAGSGSAVPGQTAGSNGGSATPVTPNAAQPTTLVGTAPAPAGKPAPETKIVLSFPKFVATFSSQGGILKSWLLTDKRYDHDETHGELLAPAGAFAVGFTKDSTYQLPAVQDWVGKQTSDHTVEYTYSTPQFDLVKDFDITPDAFTVKMTVTLKVKVPDDKEVRETLAVTSYEMQDPKKAGGGSSRIQARSWQSATLKDSSLLETPVTSLIEKGPRYESNIRWTGFEHPYLLVGFAAAPTPGVTVDKYTFAEPSGLMRTDLVWQPQFGFRKGADQLSREVIGYLGPKNLGQLQHVDAVAKFSAPIGFDQTIDFGWFAIIARPLLWLLLKLHWLVGNWGVAIILLTIVVKLATLYWTTKSMRSMKAMAVLGPQLKALQEKYKDDRQRQQVETMALYKQHNVNPLAGCLPMLLQMPIWFALYRMLQNAGELYQQPFIPGWINDLTAADPTYVLPIALVVTMFAQARLTPTTVDPSQKMQQRIMQYGMPILFGAMSFVFPAGLTLYIFTNTCLSAVHSIYMNKYDKKSIELTEKLKASKAAAVAAKEADAVKGAKDANPKTPAKDAAKEPAKDGGAEALVPQKARPNQARKKKGGRR